MRRNQHRQIVPSGCCRRNPGCPGDDAELSTNTEPNGEFRIAGLLPGHYFLRADCASGYISAIHMGDSDLPASGELAVPAGTAAQPIEAVLATDGGTVDVTASSEGDPGPGWVALIPASGNDFYARLALLKAKASFQAVAPGDYQVFAWTGSRPNIRIRQAGGPAGVGRARGKRACGRARAAKCRREARSRGCAVTAVWLIWLLAAAQAATGYRIAGVVVHAASGQPVSGARVSVAPAGQPGRPSRWSAAKMAVFRRLARGKYKLEAQRRGLLPGSTAPAAICRPR